MCELELKQKNNSWSLIKKADNGLAYEFKVNLDENRQVCNDDLRIVNKKIEQINDKIKGKRVNFIYNTARSSCKTVCCVIEGKRGQMVRFNGNRAEMACKEAFERAVKAKE